MAWNGQQWVSTETEPNASLSAQQQHQMPSSSHSNYTYTQGNSQQSAPSTGNEAYKANYWAEQLGKGDDYETLRKKAWAEYYRQQQAASSTAVTVAPPKPQPQVTKTTPSAENYPDGLTRYVHRSREGHASQMPEQRAWLSKHIEQVISNTIKSGKLWSFDWDSLKIPSFPPHLLSSSFSSSTRAVDGSLREKEMATIQEQGRQHELKEELKQQLQRQKQPKQKIESSFIEQEKKRSRSTSGEAENNGGGSYYGPAGKSSAVDLNADYISMTSTFLQKPKKPVGKKQKPKRPKKKGKQNQTIVHGFSTTNKALAARANRFGGAAVDRSLEAQEDYSKYMGAGVIKSAIGKNELDEVDYENMTVKGTCQILEKEYFRLTAPPKADKVRPQNILEQHLEILKNDWIEQRRDYSRMCSQLKAIRQDLTVQRINNSLTVKVYEMHARLALESADLNEYNQCQTQLKYLYDLVKEQIYDKYDAMAALENEVRHFRCHFGLHTLLGHVSSCANFQCLVLLSMNLLHTDYCIIFFSRRTRNMTVDHPT